MSSPWPAADICAGTLADAGGGYEQDPDLASERLPEPARRALVSLLLHRYISRARHRVAWEGILTSEDDIRARLDEMYLDLVVDHEAEVAFKRQ